MIDMNNFRSIILFLVIWLSGFLEIQGNDKTFSKDGFLFQINRDESVVILGYDSTENKKIVSDTLHIPSTITFEGVKHRVSAIGIQAFAGHAEIRHVIVDEGINRIYNQAFLGCINLESIQLPSSLLGWGEGMFSYCHRLRSIEVSKGEETLSSCDGCNAIVSVEDSILLVGCKDTTIPAGIVEIGENAFLNCTGLERLIIPEGVRIIGHGAFQGCTNLTSVSLPKTLERIVYSAFSGCESLRSLEIPENVREIEPAYLFSYCPNLRKLSVNAENPYFDSREDCNGIVRKCDSTLIAGCDFTTIPAGIVAIGPECFLHTGIRALHFPESVRNIPAKAFCGASKISSVTVAPGNKKYTSPDGCNAVISADGDTLVLGCENTLIPLSVTTIGEYSFWGRYGGTNLILPGGIKNIGAFAFAKCNRLSIVFAPASLKTLGYKAFLDCQNLSIADLTGELERVEDECFSDCTNLTIVNWGEKLRFISKGAFTNCIKLKNAQLPNK